MIRVRAAAWLWCAAALLAAGCGASPYDAAYGSWDGEAEPRKAGSALRVRWRKRMTPEYEGPYVPVEHAGAAVAPSRDRIWVGSTAGVLYAMTSSGGAVWRSDLGASIEARPAVDPDEDALYAVHEGGIVHAMRASTGEVLWKEEAGGPVREPPLLTDDAVYVITENDRVVAMARRDGSILWTYRRDPPDGFSIAGHAGLALSGDSRLVAGFGDGVVAALDARDGRVLWERDTALDLEEAEGGAPRFLDVDTTPVVRGETIHVASFSGGLYALEAGNGSVKRRSPQHTGIVALAPSPHCLVAASADEGVLCLRWESHEARWKHELLAGAPSEPVVADTTVMVGESTGDFLALSLETGEELSRIPSGNGFSATPTVAGGRGFILSNGGALLGFAY